MILPFSKTDTLAFTTKKRKKKHRMIVNVPLSKLHLTKSPLTTATCLSNHKPDCTGHSHKLALHSKPSLTLSPQTPNYQQLHNSTSDWQPYIRKYQQARIPSAPVHHTLETHTPSQSNHHPHVTHQHFSVPCNEAQNPEAANPAVY